MFKALTDVAQVAAWHLGHVEGKIAVGSVMSLTPKPGLKFGWQTKEIVKDERLAQLCVEGPGSSVGKDLMFTLSDAGGGVTAVHLSDGDWDDADPHLPFCNAHWKDRRRLVLLVRETPLHLGHLRLLVQLAEMGAVVMPPVPAFYHRPRALEAVIDQTVNRALDLLDIELEGDLFPRWQGPPGSRSTGGTEPTHMPPPAGGRANSPLSSDDLSARRRTRGIDAQL